MNNINTVNHKKSDENIQKNSPCVEDVRAKILENHKKRYGEDISNEDQKDLADEENNNSNDSEDWEDYDEKDEDLVVSKGE